MPQTIIQYDEDLDNKIREEMIKLDKTKADTIVELLKRYFKIS